MEKKPVSLVLILVVMYFLGKACWDTIHTPSQENELSVTSTVDQPFIEE